MKTQIMLGIVMLAMSSLSFAADKAPVAATEGPSDSALQDQEKAIWEAFKTRDADGFRKYFAPGYQGVYSDGVASTKDELASMKSIELKSYALSDVKVSRPTKTSALMTYKVDMQETEGGKDLSGAYYASSLWVKRGDKWLTILHTEVKGKEKK
jgi:hypothetical protein